MIKRILNKINFPVNGARFTRIAFGRSYPAFAENVSRLAREKFDGLVFDTPSPLAQWRGRTHLTKEPETIAWIDGFNEGDVFYDIGANIGVYSLYAAFKKKTQVFAFEPSPFNFATLSLHFVQRYPIKRCWIAFTCHLYRQAPPIQAFKTLLMNLASL